MPMIVRETVQDPADLRFVCPACRSVVGPLVGEIGFQAPDDEHTVRCPWCQIFIRIDTSLFVVGDV